MEEILYGELGSLSRKGQFGGGSLFRVMSSFMKILWPLVFIIPTVCMCVCVCWSAEWLAGWEDARRPGWDLPWCQEHPQQVDAPPGVWVGNQVQQRSTWEAHQRSQRPYRAETRAGKGTIIDVDHSLSCVISFDCILIFIIKPPFPENPYCRRFLFFPQRLFVDF